jgi:hypothetical protein
MTDWKQVAETLTTKARVYQAFDVGHVRDAIRLCEQAASLPDSEAVLRLAAKLPPGEAERVLEAAAEKQEHRYITVTSGMSGWFAVEVRDNEPWQAGVGRFERHEDAELEAKAWAQEDGLTYRRSKH